MTPNTLPAVINLGTTLLEDQGKLIIV